MLVAVAMGLTTGVCAWLVDPGRQGVTLRIRLIDSDSEAVPYALVRVFLLTDRGPVLLAGPRAFSVDPTYMRWPEDSVSVAVRMWKVPGPGGGRVRAGVEVCGLHVGND